MILPHSLLSVTSVKSARSTATVQKHEAPPRRPLELIGSGSLPCFEVSQTTTISVADKLKRPPSRRKIKKPTENKDPQHNQMPVKSSRSPGKASSTISSTSRPKTATSSQRKTPVRRKSAPASASKQEQQKSTAVQSTSEPQQVRNTEVPCVTQQSENVHPFLISLVSDVISEIPVVTPEPLMSVQELRQYLQDIIDPSPKSQNSSIEEALEARITEILQRAQKSSVTEPESPTSTVEVIPPLWRENYSATSATISDPLALQLEVLQVSRDCVSRVVEDGQELLQSARDWLASQSPQQQQQDTAVSDTAHKSNQTRSSTTQTRNPKTPSNLHKLTVSARSKRTGPENSKRTASERTAPSSRKSVSISSQSTRTARDGNTERTASSREQPSEASTRTRGTQTARNIITARPITARPTMRIAPKYTQTQQKMLMRKPPTVINLPLESTLLQLNMNAARRLQKFPSRGNSSAPPRLTGRFCMNHVSTQTEVRSEGPAEVPVVTSRLARQDLQPLQIPRALVMQAGPCVGITPVAVEKRTNNMKSVSLARVTPPRPQECATQTSPVSRPAVVQTETSAADSQSVMTQTESCQDAATGVTQTDTRVTRVKRPSLVAMRVIDLHVDQATVLTTAMQTDVESRGVAVQTQEHISRHWATQTTPRSSQAQDAVKMDDIGPGGDAPFTPQPPTTGEPESRNSPILQLRPKSPIRLNIVPEEPTPTPVRDHLSPVTTKVDSPEMNRATPGPEDRNEVDRQSIIRERVAASPSLMEPLTIDTLPLLRLSAKKVLPWNLRRQERTSVLSRNRLAGSSCSSSSISSLVTGTESCSDEVTDTASEAPTLCADLNACSEGKGSVWSEGEVHVQAGYTSDAKGSLRSEGEVTVTSIGEVKHHQPSEHSVGEVTGHSIPLVQRRRVLHLASRVAPHLLTSSRSFSEGEISEGQVVAQG